LPDLENIVLRDGANSPWVVIIPTKIGYLARVPSMNKEKLWGAILTIFWTLLLSDATDIPNMNTAIRAARCENCFIKWRLEKKGGRMGRKNNLKSPQKNAGTKEGSSWAVQYGCCFGQGGWDDIPS